MALYYEQYFETFSFICDKEISPNPLSAIFGVVPNEMKVSAAQSDAIAFSSLLARRLILFNWKSAISPSHRRWLGDVMAHLKLEMLKYSTRGSVEKFYKVWQPFLHYFNLKFPTGDAQVWDLNVNYLIDNRYDKVTIYVVTTHLYLF